MVYKTQQEKEDEARGLARWAVRDAEYRAAQRQQQPQGPAIASAQLGQLMNELGAAEAALNVTQDTLIEASDRQNKLDAITGDVDAVEEAELVRRYPALEA